MANENLDNPTFGNFSIVDTIEGIGSTELLNDLLGEETATADVDKLEEIVKEVKEEPVKKDEKVRGKVVVNKQEGEEPSASEIITGYLQSGEEEEEQEASTEEEKPVEQVNEVSQFNALAKDLEKLGLFTRDEGEESIEVNTPEEFLDRFKNESRKSASDMVERFLGQFGQDYQNAFDAIFVKGVHPRDYFNTFNTITSFAELDLTKEENQEKVIRQALIDQGFETDDIASEIERLKNYGDLDTVAAKHHKVLLKKETLKLQQMEQKAEQELLQKNAIKQQYVQNVQQIIEEKLKTKEFDGIPINPKLANELQDFLLTDKYKTASGETLTDFDRAILEMKRPENHAMKVKVALLLKIMEKDPTLSTIQRSGVTKKSDQLFGEYARQVNRSKTSPTEKVTTSGFHGL